MHVSTFSAAYFSGSIWINGNIFYPRPPEWKGSDWIDLDIFNRPHPLKKWASEVLNNCVPHVGFFEDILIFRLEVQRPVTKVYPPP